VEALNVLARLFVMKADIDEAVDTVAAVMKKLCSISTQNS